MHAWALAGANGKTATITTAHGVHSLSSSVAARRLPVRLRGLVTFYDPFVDPSQSCIFLHDATGDIFISLPKLPVLPLRQGTLVEVTGWSGAGEFAPIVAEGHVRVLDKHPRDVPAPLVTLPLLMGADYDARFLEIEGVVQGIVSSDRNVVLKLATGHSVVRATVLREVGFDYGQMVDAQVRVRANVGPQFNHRRQVIGAHLYFQSMADVIVERKPPTDPFAGTPRAIHDLTRITSGFQVLNSLHVRGRVTLQWPGRMLCLQDASGGLCLESPQEDVLALGELVDAVGFPTVEDSTTGLVGARFVGRGAAMPLAPPRVKTAELLGGHHAGELVTIEGKLLGTDQDVGTDSKDWTLTMESGGRAFPVIVPGSMRQLDWHARVPGSVLRLTGVSLPQVDPHHEEVEERESGYDSFRLMLRSPADIVVLQTPSWWSGPHVRNVLLAGALMCMAGCVWVIVLRRQVEEQTHVIRSSEERFRHLAEHDGLTGLANRRLLHERLEEALANAKSEHECMAVLTMDLDRFKQVNDTFGHHVGDAMLCAAAERIRASVRVEDTVARMGGDEFVVLLPKLRDAREADAAAERIVRAIALPLEVDGQLIPMSASVGVCAYPEGGGTTELLLRNCDTALYVAKTQGRNCWQAFGELSYSR